MERRVVGLFFSPWGANPARPEASRSLLQMFRYAVGFKTNPRDAPYMQQLFRENYPDGEFTDVDQHADWRDAAMSADAIVLLYPDAIGLGFTSLEREVRRIRKTGAAVRVLNGRRRDFALAGSTLLALRLRRIIERSMLGEILFVPVFLCVTPLLLLVDWSRGRR